MLAQPRLGKIEFYAIFSIRNSKQIIQRMTAPTEILEELCIRSRSMLRGCRR
ncbi:Uncharacterised protein [Segatella copri]|nr:Uncharacterised protein [Segatella copri]